jgi:competence protein ComGC
MSDKVKKKSIFSNVFFLIYLAGVIILTFLGSLLSSLSFKKVHYSVRDKACYSNIRVLQGAVEMYNMDHETMMTILDQRQLRDSHYIKTDHDLICPETSIGATYSGDHLTDDGEIICSYHGGLISKGPYDKVKESQKAKESKNQIVNKILPYLVNFLNSLFWPLWLVGALLYLLHIIP